jgi:curved DNA-binding protein CbpA
MLPPRRLSEEELRLFSDRIAVNLVNRPLDLPVSEHRERVAALLRRMGEATLYEMLEIDPSSPVPRVHEGYEQVARLVHPENAKRLDLMGREGVLEVLFERITEAYLTLSDPDQRKRYDREQPVWRTVEKPLVSRVDEAQRLYEKARVLASSEQFHAAIELLREAVRTTPKADYLALLGLLQAKNPLWLRYAEEHLRQAIDKGAKDPSLPSALAEVRRRIETGDTADAAGASKAGGDSHEVEIL